jgi:hypothetical protein
MEHNLPPNIKLIFLVGAPRSGTTWLQLLLSASPLIATAVETQFFSRYAKSLFSTWQRASDRGVGLRKILDEEEYFGLIRQLTSTVFARILAGKPGATIILEKTPDHALHWKDILTIFPDALFIHIIRDPRAVVASLRSASQSWADWETPSVTAGCTHWTANVAAARKIRNATPNYLEVRYEDLKLHGVRTLRSVFGRCGIDLSEADAASILRRHEIDRLRSSEAPKLAKEYSSLGENFFRTGQIDSWRSELSRRQIAIVERLAGGWMDDLGYARQLRTRGGYRSVSIPWAMPLGWLCNGLGWRLRRYGDTLTRWG